MFGPCCELTDSNDIIISVVCSGFYDCRSILHAQNIWNYKPRINLNVECDDYYYDGACTGCNFIQVQSTWCTLNLSISNRWSLALKLWSMEWGVAYVYHLFLSTLLYSEWRSFISINYSMWMRLMEIRLFSGILFFFIESLLSDKFVFYISLFSRNIKQISDRTVIIPNKMEFSIYFNGIGRTANEWFMNFVILWFDCHIRLKLHVNGTRNDFIFERIFKNQPYVRIDENWLMSVQPSTE